MPPSWDECDIITQADLIAYDRIRDEEEFKEKIEFAKANMPVV